MKPMLPWGQPCQPRWMMTSSPQFLAQVGIESREQFDRIAERWNERMGQDETYQLVTTYGTAFAAGGWGEFGEAGQQAAMGTVEESEEPVPFEKYCEIMGAFNAWSAKGEDVNEKLKEVFQMKAMDYANIGSWWSFKMLNDAGKTEQMMELINKYEKQYS